ncbi:MAG: hypothetical protein C0609_11490, partial [Deltaproteobacteria bacterium]
MAPDNWCRMIISRPQIKCKNGQVIYKVDVKRMEGETSLWYSLDEEYADYISPVADAALIALLIPAMAAGENITIEGGV